MRLFSRIWIGSIGRNGKINAAPAMLNMLPKLELAPISTYFDTFSTVPRPAKAVRHHCAMARRAVKDMRREGFTRVFRITPAQASEQAVPIGEAFNKLVQVTGDTPAHLTQVLYQSHHVGLTWYVFAAIGVASAVMIYLYGQWIQKLAKREATK